MLLVSILWGFHFLLHGSHRRIVVASETSVTAAAVIASTAVSAANNNHPRDGHNINNCLHNGHDNVINDRPPSLSFLSNNNKGNAFPTPTRHAPSNAYAATTTTPTAVAATATDKKEEDDNNNVQIHPPPQH